MIQVIILRALNEEVVNDKGEAHISAVMLETTFCKASLVAACCSQVLDEVVVCNFASLL